MTVVSVPHKSGSITKLRTTANGCIGEKSPGGGGGGGVLIGEHIALSSPPHGEPAQLRSRHTVVTLSGNDVVSHHCEADTDDDEANIDEGAGHHIDAEAGAIAISTSAYRAEEIISHPATGHEMLLLRLANVPGPDGGTADERIARGEIVYLNEQPTGRHKRETTTLV